MTSQRGGKRRQVVSRSVLVAVVAAASGVFAGAGTAQTAGSQSRARLAAAKCAKLKLRATPAVNTTMAAETIKSRVTNCSSARETVTLTQTIAGPDVRSGPVAKRWTITLSPGESVVKKRSFPYACCGSYKVTDKVLTASGTRLAKATATFTFA